MSNEQPLSSDDLDMTRRLVSVIDHTALGDQKQDGKGMEEAIAVCNQAKKGNTAAVCVWPEFVPIVRELLKDKCSNVRIATVVNFPDGGCDIESVKNEINQAVRSGAEEIDVVFPYDAYLRGEQDKAVRLIEECRQVCRGKILLKVILETEKFNNASDLEQAAKACIQAGADFLKTSTGKIMDKSLYKGHCLTLDSTFVTFPLHGPSTPS